MCGKGHRHLSDLPESKITDEWKFSVSESGFANRKVTLQVLQDLDAYLTRTKTQRPVILWVDGFSGHRSLEIAEFCADRGIHMLAFLENSTHILQVISHCIFIDVNFLLLTVLPAPDSPVINIDWLSRSIIMFW